MLLKANKLLLGRKRKGGRAVQCSERGQLEGGPRLEKDLQLSALAHTD